MTDTIVLGLGNLVHATTASGVHAIYVLAARSARPARRRRSSTAARRDLALLPHLSGVRRLLVIDAIDVGEALRNAAAFRREGAARSARERPAFTSSDSPI